MNYYYFLSENILYFQANAPRWLCYKAWGCRLILQWHATGSQHKLWLQLQEEVSLSVAPADLHPVLHSLHPIHFSEHLTVWLQVCHLIITHSFAGKLCVFVSCVSPNRWCVRVCSKSCFLTTVAFIMHKCFINEANMFKVVNCFCNGENAENTSGYSNVTLGCNVIISQLIMLPSFVIVSTYFP